LPSGVFQPYSGVKTSILLFDKETARTTKNVLFVKIQHDGFDLGAQRREIDKNDLPLALNIIKKFKSTLSDTEFSEDEKQLAHVVAKEKIIESGDYNLSGERYKEVVNFVHQKWPMVELEEVCEILNGYAFKSENYVNNGVRIIRITNVQKGQIVDDNPKFYPINSKEPIAKYNLRENDLLVSLTGNVGRVGLLPKDFLPAVLNQRVACLRAKENKINVLFLFYILNQNKFEDDCVNSASGIAQKNLSTVWLSKYKIPLPPLEVQKEIVEQIEVKQKAIDHAKAVIESLEKERRYFGQALKNLEGVEWVELGEVVEERNIRVGDNFLKYTICTISSIHKGFIDQKDYFEKKVASDNRGNYKIVKRGWIGYRPPGLDIGTIGLQDLADQVIVSPLYAVFEIINNSVSPKYLIKILQSESFKSLVKPLMLGSARPLVSPKDFIKIKIPLPPLEVQKQLVAEAEKEEEIITANRRLIEIMERKIEEVLSNI
jgi:restriction endonuclease S subunit